jgi:hypothetical protein
MGGLPEASSSDLVLRKVQDERFVLIVALLVGNSVMNTWCLSEKPSVEQSFLEKLLALCE